MSEITVQTWGVRFSGRRLASIPGHKGASGIDTITISYTGFLKLSGATFEDPEGGELRRYFDGNYTFNILITADNFNLIFENPVGLTYFEVPFESDNKYLINLRQFSHLARVFGGPGLSVKGRNNALEYLVYFGQDGDYAREGLSFKTGWYFKADGDGTGVATMRLTASEATELQADGNVLFCDAEGQNETTTVNLIAEDNVIYFKCEFEDGYIYLQNDKITKLGTESLSLFELPVNAPIPYVQIGEIYNLLNIRIYNIKTYLFGAPPSGVTYWRLDGSNIFWTYTGAPPSGVTTWYLSGSNIFWTYEGAPPSGVTYWRLYGSNIFWTYTGAPPSGVNYWYLYGSNIFWTYTGAPPSGVTNWYLSGSNINNINTNFSGNSKYSIFNISNWRLEKIGDAELIEILNSLKDRVGTMPSTIQIGDYLNYANPPQAVIDAVDALKIAKNITTVTLSI